MPAKTTKSLPAYSTTVKTISKSCLGAVIFGLSTVPSSALAYGMPTTERVVTVTFKPSDVATTAGQVDIYSRLLETADATCRADMKTLKYYNESVEDCVADLMDQFIETADVEKLTAYHQSQS